MHPAFLVLGGTAGLVRQVLDGTEARAAEVARAARLSPSAAAAALRVLAAYGLAERGRGGWRRGDASLDDVAGRPGRLTCTASGPNGTGRTGRAGGPGSGSTGRPAPAGGERDGWLSLETDEYDLAACRWPVLPPTLSRAAAG